jgi:hypothetical protein
MALTCEDGLANPAIMPRRSRRPESREDARPAGGAGRLFAPDGSTAARPFGRGQYRPSIRSSTMNDINGRSCDSRTDTMATRLPEVTRLLKARGVRTVIASYGGPMIALVFVDANEMPMLVDILYRHTVEIAEVFRSLLKSRHPSTLTSLAECGTFEWDLCRDTLEHQHTVTHRGL